MIGFTYRCLIVKYGNLNWLQLVIYVTLLIQPLQILKKWMSRIDDIGKMVKFDSLNMWLWGHWEWDPIPLKASIEAQNAISHVMYDI